MDERNSNDNTLTSSGYVKPTESETKDFVAKPTVFANLVISTEEQERAKASKAAIQLANLTAAERKRQRRQQRNLKLLNKTGEVL